MNHLDNYDYGSSTGFVSTTKQINNHMDAFREANKAALDRNTAAINHQTDVLERVITEQTNRTEAIISAQTVNQNIQAEKTRTNFTTLFHKLIDTVKGIFSKDKTDEVSGTTTFYEMVQAENDQTQAYMSGQTSTLNTALNNIKSQLENVKRAIDQNTSGDSVNTDLIKRAIDGVVINIENNYHNI